MRTTVLTHLRYLAILILTGIMAGIVGALCSALLHSIEHVVWDSGGLGHHTLIEGAAYTTPEFRFLMLCAAGMVAAISWALIVKTGTIPRISTAMSGATMPLLRTIWHAITQIVVVAMGASAGREAAPREIASAFGSHLGKTFHLNSSDRRVIVACAAGAGLSAVYAIPFSGFFFTLEAMLLTKSVRNIYSAFVVNATAVLIASGGTFPLPFYKVPELHHETSHLVWVFLAGPIIGVTAFFFRRAVHWAESNRPENLHVAYSLPLTFLGVGALAAFTPTVLGNGQAAAQTFFKADHLLNPGGLAVSGSIDPRPLEAIGLSITPYFHAASTLTMPAVTGLVVLLTVIKATGTLATIRSGAWGGTLTPSLAIGAGVSATLGLMWTAYWPTESFATFVFVGAAAFLGVSLSAPVTGMALLIEFTRVNAHTPALILVIIVLLAQVSARFCDAVSKKKMKRTIAEIDVTQSEDTSPQSGTG